VINGLRIDLGGEIAQMDHLVLHPYGLLIVESKSVSGSVQIKDDGQWIRWFAKQPSGMRSPVTQARMQGMLLRDLLEAGVKQKGFFDRARLDVLVAISDTGTIQWPASGALPEVCKADQVAERLIARIDQFRSGLKEPDLLTAEHRRRIGDFLCRMHKPVVAQVGASPVIQVAAPPPPPQVLAPKAAPMAAPDPTTKPSSLPEPKCKHCGSDRVDVVYGKFGYYFLCKACEKNTALKFDCPACGQTGRIRKDGSRFFAECKSCTASALFHTNQGS
jgi:transcription elongation factor Elf1